MVGGHMETSMEVSINQDPKRVQIEVEPLIIFNLFNINLWYDLVLQPCFVVFMFMFLYFMIIKICLYFGLAHFMFLVLGFVLLSWFLCFVCRIQIQTYPFIIYFHSFCAHDKYNKVYDVCKETSNLTTYSLAKLVTTSSQKNLL